MTTTPVDRLDYRAHVRAPRSAFLEVVREVRDILGTRLCAYLGSVTETRAGHQWPEGSGKPNADVQRHLRTAL